MHANFCTKCGSPVAAGTRFCRSCGAPVAAMPQQAPPMGPPTPSPTNAVSPRRRAWAPFALGGAVLVALAAFALRDGMPFSADGDAVDISPGLVLTAPTGWTSLDTEAGQMMALNGTNIYSELPEGPRITLRSSNFYSSAETSTGFTKAGAGAFTILEGPTELTVASHAAMSLVVQEGDAGGLVGGDGSPLGTITRHVTVALGNGRSALILMEVPAATYEQHRGDFDAALATARLVP